MYGIVTTNDTLLLTLSLLPHALDHNTAAFMVKLWLVLVMPQTDKHLLGW